MACRRPSRTAVKDDRGIAAVVGFVLVLAAAVTYYSYAAQNDVPRIGAQRESEWDAAVGAALTRLAQAAGDRAGTDAAVQEVIPPAPEAPTQAMAFLAPLRSARASGSLSFTEECGGASLSHQPLGSTDDIIDLASGARGCLTFRGDTAYADRFAYRIELGGVLRLQGDQAAVLAGPPLEVDDDGRVALTLIDLRGDAQTLGMDRASAPVGFSPRPSSLEVGATPNVGSAAWSFTTTFPEAWMTWYDEQLGAAGDASFDEDSCDEPEATGLARGECTVLVEIGDATSLSISYARYDVSLG